MVAGAPGSQPADSYSSGTQQYDHQQAIGHLPQQFGQQSQQQPEQLDLDKERREGTLSYDHLRNQHRQRFAIADWWSLTKNKALWRRYFEGMNFHARVVFPGTCKLLYHLLLHRLFSRLLLQMSLSGGNRRNPKILDTTPFQIHPCHLPPGDC